jgi:hypothetical protein
MCNDLMTAMLIRTSGGGNGAAGRKRNSYDHLASNQIQGTLTFL